jgi:hypothetical protein
MNVSSATANKSKMTLAAKLPSVSVCPGLFAGLEKASGGTVTAIQVVLARSDDELDAQVGRTTSVIVNLARANDVRRINKLFKAVHGALHDGGLFAIGFETLQRRRRRIRAKYPPVVATGYYVLTFAFHRVCPKLPGLKRLYFALTRGYGRPLSRAEVLGRLCYCGFDIVDVLREERLVYVIARKARPPCTDPRPSYGPLMAMERVGHGGRPIRVYKLRTMRAGPAGEASTVTTSRSTSLCARSSPRATEPNTRRLRAPYCAAMQEDVVTLLLQVHSGIAGSSL